jgi:hypothetical protein
MLQKITPKQEEADVQQVVSSASSPGNAFRPPDPHTLSPFLSRWNVVCCMAPAAYLLIGIYPSQISQRI